MLLAYMDLDVRAGALEVRALEVRAARWLAACGEPAELVVDAGDVASHTSHRVTASIELTTSCPLRVLAAAAVADGARKVRICPSGVDEVELVRAAVEVRSIASEHAVEVQFDVASRTALLTRPDDFLRLDPLVVEEDGTVVPLCSGIDRRYALGSLAESSLESLVARWDATPVLRLCRAAWRHAIEQPGPLVAWYDHLVRTSAAMPAAC